MQRQPNLAKSLFFLLVFAFFYAPIFILIFLSFNNTKYSLLWHGFTWEWYRTLFQDTDLWIAAAHSLIIGLLAATLGSIIGLLAAISLYRYRFLGRQILNALIFILIISPDIVMGTALLILFSLGEIPLGFWTLLLAHITFCIPFVAITVYSRIIDIDANIFHAAQDLGASEFVILWRIIIPLLLPAILAGWLLSFTLSIDDVIISYFVAGPSFQILPLQIYSMVRLGINPEINALCSIVFLATILLVTLSQFILHKRGNSS
jgi:spermidine/putrescine transport system permease protein